MQESLNWTQECRPASGTTPEDGKIWKDHFPELGRITRDDNYGE